MMKKRIRCIAVVFLTGGLLYGLTEILWRRYTHWSMILTGGLCLSVLYAIFERISACRLRVKCLVGAAVITWIEFMAGFLFNHCLRLNVWDYSGRRGNICGQICPLYSFLWGLLTIPIVSLCQLLHRHLK